MQPIFAPCDHLRASHNKTGPQHLHRKLILSCVKTTLLYFCCLLDLFTDLKPPHELSVIVH